MKLTITIILVLLLVIVWKTQYNGNSTQNITPPILNRSTSTDQGTTNRETSLPTDLPTTQQLNKNNYPKTTKGDSKPFWTDTEIIQVCKVPYYTSEGCNDSDVTLVSDTTTQFQLSNGAYIITNNLTCYGGNGSGDEPKYVFCRSWDSNNQQWDFFPTWVRI